MNDKRTDLENGDSPRGLVQWMSPVIPCLVCGVIVGLFVWMTDPNATLESTGSGAKDSYYNLLVQGFRSGHLYVNKAVPPALARLADPYNPALNSAYIAPVNDLSYFKGKFYTYFGVTPALVLFWPYVLLTGHYLSDGAAVAIFFATGFAMALGLMRALCRRYFPEVNIWMFTAYILAIGLALGLTLSGSIYTVARVCGFAFASLALMAIWRALHARAKSRVLWLLLASLAYGLAVGSRPSLLFGVIILLIPVIQAWREQAVQDSRWRAGLLFAAAVGPAMLIGLGLMLYNDLRFGNPFEFGWHYQLNGNYEPTTARQFSLHYLWFNFQVYFLEPFGWTGRFPFLQNVPLPPLPAGYYTGMGGSNGGILDQFPMVLLALAVPLAWRNRPAAIDSSLRWFIMAVFTLFVICTLTLCIFFAGGDSYELDFLPWLLLLSFIGLLGWERMASRLPVWRLRARGGGCLLLAWSLLFNLLLNIENHAEMDYLLGNSFLSQGWMADAINQYKKALSLWPSCPEAYGGIGNALFQMGDIDGAILQYQKAIEFKPDFTKVYHNLGYCLLERGRLDDAIVQYENALKYEPNYPDAYNNLGYCFLHTGRIDEAVAQSQKAVELEPGNANFRCGLGNALLQQRHPDLALVQYQQAVEIQPDLAGAHYDLASCLLQMGRVNDATVQYQNAVKLKPVSATYHSGLGNALFQGGFLDQAIVQYQAALKLQPRSADVCERLGNAFFRKGLLSEATVQYQKAVELKPDFVEAHNNLGYCFFQAGHVDDAIAQYQTAIELQPAFAPAYKNLGDAFYRKGLTARALASYQKAIALQPQFMPAQINLAWMLATWPEAPVRNGSEAVALMEKANQLSGGKDPLVLRTLAAAYAEVKRFPDAASTAQTALALANGPSSAVLAKELQTEIELYQSHSPCRSTNN